MSTDRDARSEMAKLPGKYQQTIVGVWKRALSNNQAAVADGVLVRPLPFTTDDVRSAASAAGVRPGNLPDVMYRYRFRSALPDEISQFAGRGEEVHIRLHGAKTYTFESMAPPKISFDLTLPVTAMKDNRPAVVRDLAQKDEQAVVATLFTSGILNDACRAKLWHVQAHCRTKVEGIQIEIDDLYAAEIDSKLYLFTVQVKGPDKGEQVSKLQLEQDAFFCRTRHPGYEHRMVGIKQQADGTVSIVVCLDLDSRIVVERERRYRVIAP